MHHRRVDPTISSMENNALQMTLDFGPGVFSLYQHGFCAVERIAHKLKLCPPWCAQCDLENECALDGFEPCEDGE